jgi:hypothetical protein
VLIELRSHEKSTQVTNGSRRRNTDPVLELVVIVATCQENISQYPLHDMTVPKRPNGQSLAYVLNSGYMLDIEVKGCFKGIKG